MASNCKIIYPSGEVSQVTYQCVQNYDWEDDLSYVETDDFDRADDGTATSYPGARKKVFDLTFSYVSKAQLDAWILAWNVGAPIDLYLDGDNAVPDAIVVITEPISRKSKAAWVDGQYTYSFDVHMEEI